MHAALDPLLGQLDCEGCQKSFQDRIKDLFVQWTAVAVGHSVIIKISPLSSNSHLRRHIRFPIRYRMQFGWGYF